MAISTNRTPESSSRLLLTFVLFVALAIVASACGIGDGSDTDPVAGDLVLTDEAAAVVAAANAPQTVPALVAPPTTFAAVLGDAQAGVAATTPTSPVETTPPTTAAATTTPTVAAETTTAPATEPTSAPAEPATDDPSQPTTMATEPAPNTTSAQIVEFRIAAGTGSQPWNSFDDPVRVQVGQILRIHNDDSVAHTLHAGGTPVKHGQRIDPGSYRDHLVLNPYTPVEGSSKLYDHNNGRSGTFWVVAA